jgi:DNA-binding MarR family transcriptional regulator
VRGYLERRVDPEDRRRMGVRPTERGRAAAATIQAAIEEIDGVLTGRITAAELHRGAAGVLAEPVDDLEREADLDAALIEQARKQLLGLL